jgi:site-specific DNA-methyltransferase (adenine-specific)
MKTISDLIQVLLFKSLATILQENKKDAPFIFQKVGWILLTTRLLPGLEGITEVSMKNANKGFAKITDYIRDFLNIKIKDGNADGKSDGTFRIGKTSFLTSAKFREGDEVSIAADMDAINTLHGRREEFNNANYVMFVRDRSIWIAAHMRANTKHLYPINYNHVYDVNMFENAIIELRNIINKYNGSINDFAIKYLPYLRSRINLKFHQHLGQIMYIPRGTFLFAMKCRSGKTVSAAYNIISQNYKTVLYITPVPSETKNAAIDTFRRYIEFDDYDVINLEAGANIHKTITKPTIMVASKQYLDKHHSDEFIKAIHFDAIFQDEMHWAGLTAKTDQIRLNLVRENTSLIALTGTGERVRIQLSLDDSHIFHWNIEEEAACKRGDIKYLEDVYGKDNVANALIKTFGETDDYGTLLRTMYADMPILRQMIYKPKPTFLEKFAQFNEKDEYSLDMQELFRMKDGELVYYDRVVKFLKSYLGSDDGSVHDSIMDQIRSLGTRTGNYGVKYYAGGGGATQPWFLPEQVIGGSLNSLSNALKSIIDEHFPEYTAVVVNSSAKLDTREGMEKFVAEQEKIAIGNKKQGLILLLGKMMAMGVSLPRADIVCMFNNLSKIDLYTQMSMRCLTQDDGKSTGYVIDFNQKRVLEASMALVPRCEGTGSEIIDRMTKVIAFGANSFETKDITEIVAHFTKIWKTQAFDKVKVIGNRLSNYVGTLNVTLEEKNEILRSTWKKEDIREHRERQEILNDCEKIADAKSVASAGSDNKKDENEQPETLDDVIPNFEYEVLTTIPPFVAFLTYQHKREGFISYLLTQIRDDALLNEVFCNQCVSWWKGAKNLNFIDLLINIFARCDVKTSRGISVIISAIKSEMASLIDDMHATLDFLNTILAPKQSEKDEFSEVFTPYWFVDDNMLAAYPPETWTNPDEKFYDPAAGSGVFGVCIYYRLMDGLRTVFPDETKRKMHILTKMLFMSELTAKNVWILKHIFGLSANIYHGDSLKFDAEKYWGFDMKNVHVIGNPPYNSKRTRSGATPIYDKFIEKYCDKCKTLSFVVPSRWFSGGKGLDKFRSMMLARRDIRMIQHFQDSKEVFGTNVDIEGGVNHFVIDSSYSGYCSFNGKNIDLSSFDILVESKYIGIVQKAIQYTSLSSLYEGRRYKIETNDSRLSEDTSMLKCHVSRQKGAVKYIPYSEVDCDYSYFKVITAEANGKQKKFGNIFLGSPNEVHSGSYVSFRVKNETEGHSLISFMKTKFANTLLGIRKISQHINQKTCEWIPLPPLDRIWDDAAVTEYYKLTHEEITALD